METSVLTFMLKPQELFVSKTSLDILYAMNDQKYFYLLN